MKQHNTFYIKLIVAAIALFAAVAVSSCLGSSSVTASDVLKFLLGKANELDPTRATAALVGGALASVGCVMQGVFKNPMADPSVLGISSGSAFGAAVAIVFGLNGMILGEGFTGSYIGAIIGAVITWLAVFFIAQGSGEYDTTSTLLAGVAISSIMSALITVLMTLHMDSMERVYMWMLGTFSSSTLPKTKILVVVVAICVPLLIFISPQIDVLKLGRETALSLGVRQSRTLGATLCLASILLAFCVANSGIIGFVGLIIPHVVGFFRIYKMRQKLIMSFLVGAIFMVLCDTVAKTVVAPGEMAIGAITSLIGAPYFLRLLIASRIRAGKKGLKI